MQLFSGFFFVIILDKNDLAPDTILRAREYVICGKVEMASKIVEQNSGALPPVVLFSPNWPYQNNRATRILFRLPCSAYESRW